MSDRIKQTNPVIQSDEATLVHVLRRRSEGQAAELACVHLVDGRGKEVRLTYAELDGWARRVGAFLQERGATGRPVLLVYPPGTDFLIGFLGCLYAGAIATPTYPPDPRRIARTLPRFQAIVSDSGAAMVLTTRALKQMASQLFQAAPELEALEWAAADGLPVGLEESWSDLDLDADELGLLQYTSGSTGTPKGVMVTHRNLMLNFRVLTEKFETPEGSVALTWLPNYHDMGLIDGLLRPLYAGQTCVFMSPIAFLKQPIRWLEAITKWRAVVSGGPNFAYDLCVKQITEAQLERLDLSSWTSAYNGAEPVRAETLERFARVFEPVGFRAEAAWPCYGLAEATLFVTGGGKREPPQVLRVSKQALSRHEVMPVPADSPDGIDLVGCGTSSVERLLIVDPETREPCPPFRVGEVWLSGPSIAVGYWERPDATRETFEARLADGDGPFMRTGDLGFLRDDGELFITGRLKDLIVIRGRNHYPQDIERTVEKAAPEAIRPGCGAAFSVDVAGEERLVVVHELERRYAEVAFGGKERRQPDPAVDAFTPDQHTPPSPGELTQAIRRAIAEQHDLQVHAVVLIQAGSVPKTSSGKIRRKACRADFLGGKLKVLHRWEARQEVTEARRLEDASATVPRLQPGRVEREIRQWLAERLEERLRLPAGTVEADEPFASYGLDSKEAVLLTGDLEAWLGVELPATVMYDHPTVARLARYLGTQALDRSASASGSTQGAPADKDEPIAVIGIGCRFPGASNPEEFWRLLTEARDATREVPRDRWKVEEVYDPDPSAPGKAVTARGGFLDQVDGFDPHFFSISPREAERMDPQQRLLLEVAWEALEDAGLRPRELMGTPTGVFIGISNSDYSRILFSDRDRIDAYFGTGSAFSIAANRLSYFFDLRGPSMSIDTACSSSLLAVHEAVKSLRSGESTLAIAGGVNAILTPDITINFSKAGVMAPDGRCKTFDAAADGYARSEGAGVVILKPLSRALEDGDPVHAVLLGSAANNDGRTNGLMAPNGVAQAEVLKQAYARAGVSPGEVHYIETHGTGTALGDPIEVQAIGAVVGQDRPADRPCAIGAVKSLIGHLEAAAGIAGFIKVVLALKHRRIPPSRKVQTPNPRIPFDRLPVKVQQTLEPWPAPPGTGLAGVSSFGFGGTNVHVVLQEPPAKPPARAPRRHGPQSHLLVLSAATPGALRDAADRFARFVVTGGTEAALEDLCYTAALRREALTHRLSVVVESHRDAAEKLRKLVAGESVNDLFQARPIPEESRRVVFLCPGQGPQWIGMGRDLMATEPVFRERMEACDALLTRMFGWSLLDALSADEGSSRLHETEVTQPALFAIQVSLAALWQSWGVYPDLVIGHSMGEVAAATIAGAIDLETGIRIIHHRGKVMQRVSGQGAMAAVALSLEEAREALEGFEGKLSVAANNGPASCSVSGDPEALTRFLADLEAREVFHRRLKVDLAGHSPHMDRLMDPLVEAIGDVQTRTPRIPIVSTVTTEEAGEETFRASYWARNLREPVLFHTVLVKHATRGHPVFVEMSPHPTLLNAVEDAIAQAGGTAHALPSIRRKEPERRSMLASLGALHCLGVPVDFRPLFSDAAQCVALPGYPWQRKRFWFDVREQAGDRGRGRGAERRHPLVGTHVALASRPGHHCWDVRLDLEDVPFIADHQVQGVVVFPATAYLEMVQAAVAEHLGARHTELSEVTFDKAMFLGPGSARQVQLEMTPAETRGTFRFEVFSRPDGEPDAPWVRHVHGSLNLAARPRSERPPRERPAGASDLEGLRQTLVHRKDGARHYAACSARGVQYGPAFQGVDEIWRGKEEALGRVVLPEQAGRGRTRYLVHPALFDACLQVMAVFLPEDVADPSSYLPVHLDRLRVMSPPSGVVWSHVVARGLDRPDPGKEPEQLVADVRLLDESGRVLVEVEGFTVQRLDRSAMGTPVRSDWCYDLSWRSRPSLVSVGDPVPVAGVEGEHWLVLADESGVGRRVCRALRDAGARCWEVWAGHPAPGAGPDSVTVDPERPGALKELVERLSAESGRGFDRILDLWSLDMGAAEQLSADDLQREEVARCRQVVELVQAATLEPGAGNSGERTGATGGVVWVVTRSAQPAGGALVEPAQAVLWGLGRGLAHEAPGVWGGLVDLGPEPVPEDATHVLSAVMEGGDDTETAFRGESRWVSRLVRRPVPGICPAPTLSADGTYLVTGGLGSLGLKIARWLVDHGAGHLVLTGRSAPEDRTEWEVSAALGLEPAASLVRLEAAGARVTTVRVDAADEAGMASVFQRIDREGPPLRGIVHAAGVVTTRGLGELDEDELAHLFRPKVMGAWILHRLSLDQALDFFILFSSAAATWGSRMLAHYGAANHFLDALAHHRRALGLPGLSVDWAMWGESGMATQSDNARMLRNMGLNPMPPDEALRVLEQLLAVNAVQVTVAAVDWQVFKPMYEQQPRRKLLEDLEIAEEAGAGAATAEDSGTLVDRLQEEHDVSARADLVTAFVAELAAGALGVGPEDLDLRAPLTTLGMDSLTASELRNRIQAGSGVRINVVHLLRGDSVEQVAAEVLQGLDTRLEHSATSGAGDAGVPVASGASSPAGAGEGPGLEGEASRSDQRINPVAIGTGRGGEVDADAEVAALMTPELEPSQARPWTGTAPRHLLLTGAAGFLGGPLLAELCRDRQARVTCLVRGPDQATARARVIGNLAACGLLDPSLEARLEVIPGDLASPSLGLDEATWSALAREVDGIVHAGFLVNFLFSYEDLRATNVLGTRELLRLATTERVKPFHFVSSFSVFLTPENAGKVVLEEDIPFPGPGGYRESKRVCEALVRAAGEQGLPVAIHRPPFITWDTRTGRYNERDFLIQLLLGCLELGVAPEVEPLFHMTPVDVVAAAIAALVRDPRSPGRAYNILGDETGTVWPDLVRMLNQVGARLESAPFDAWREQVRSAPGNPLYQFFPGSARGESDRGAAVLALFDRSTMPARVAADQARAALGGRLAGPNVSPEQLRVFLERVEAGRADRASGRRLAG